jgi:hypothetical protein
MLELYGLDKLRESGANNGVYCPICRNYLETVSNGWVHGQLFYCPKDKKIFSINLRDITKKAGDDYLKSCEKEISIKNIRKLITEDNYRAVLEAIEKSKL